MSKRKRPRNGDRRDYWNYYSDSDSYSDSGSPRYACLVKRVTLLVQAIEVNETDDSATFCTLPVPKCLEPMPRV